MEAVRSGGDLENVGGDGTAKPLGNPNFHKGGFWKEP